MRRKQLFQGLRALLAYRHRLRYRLAYKLREVYIDTLLRWILYSRSQPFTISQKPALIVSPHQDDETLGCGGLIALKRAQGVPVHVVFLTDGQKSHRQDSRIDPIKLVQIRQREAIKALTTLGVQPSEIHFLDLLDGTLADLAEAQRQAVTDQLVQYLQAWRPQEVYVTYQSDRLSDHEAAFALIKTAIAASGIAAELFQYPIWVFWRATLGFDLKWPELNNLYQLSIHTVQAQKKQAIAAYRSQLQPLAPGSITVLPRSFLKRFSWPFEVYIRG